MKGLNTGDDARSCVVVAPFGALELCFVAGELSEIRFLPPGTPARRPAGEAQKRAANQIRSYLRNPLSPFSFELPRTGTEFQRLVWREIASIPPGQTRSYGAIARRLGTSPRAVGNATGANPLAVMIPCHRVISSSGGLGGFMGAEEGWGMDVKRWLLRHESDIYPRP